LLDRVQEFVRKSRDLLSEPGHGIPSVAEINKNGRRQQDKANLRTQMAAENAKVASLTWEKITVDMVTKLACTTSLSNDRVLRLGDDRLQLCIKIAEMSNQKFWKDMAVPCGTHPHRYIMKTAWKAFPHFHQLVYRKIDAQPDRTKVKVMSNIGKYLRKSKCTSKSICEYLYGINGSQKAVPKRERMFEPGDILDIFKFFRVIEVNGTEDVCKAAALAITSSFECISEHYTYTLCMSEDETVELEDEEINVNDVDTNSGELMEDGADDEVNLLTIT
jgi:hypothetical protein